MRARTVVVTMTVIALALAPTSVGRAASGGEFFASAHSAGTDPATGTEHFVSLASSGARGEPALFEYSESFWTPVTCPDGQVGAHWVDSGGSGTGVLDVRPNLARATLRAVVDIDTTDWLLCDPVPEPTVTHQSAIPVAFDLIATGHRWRDTERHLRLAPARYNALWGSKTFGRQATGTITVAGTTSPITYGDLGRVRATSREHWHETWQQMDTLVHAGTWLSAHATASPPPSSRGFLDRAEGLFEQYGEDASVGVYVGADRERGATTVFAAGYGARTIECRDGTTSALETYRSAEGPGSLDVGANFRSASAGADVDVTVIRIDGCTGEVTSWVDRGVRAELAIQATEPRFVAIDSAGRLEPSVENARAWVKWVGRMAAGTVSLGTSSEPTTWAQIGRQSWRYHGLTTASG